MPRHERRDAHTDVRFLEEHKTGEGYHIHTNDDTQLPPPRCSTECCSPGSAVRTADRGRTRAAAPHDVSCAPPLGRSHAAARAAAILVEWP